MSHETVKRFNEWATWCNEHAPYMRNADPEQANKFLMKTLEGCMECLRLAIVDIQKMEEGPKSHSALLIPPWFKQS